MNVPVRDQRPQKMSDISNSYVDKVDAYFSADVETDGPVPGPFSMLSFALVYAGRGNGKKFFDPKRYDVNFYRELSPISDNFQQEALDVNGLDRASLRSAGGDPRAVMTEAAQWVRDVAGDDIPVLVAYPLSFDWSWLYWYFTMFSESGSPFGYSSCFDMKTALAVATRRSISMSGRSKIPKRLSTSRQHTHHAVDDATEQAEIFSNLMKEI